MTDEVLCFKRANIVHDVASELYGLFRVAKLPGNRVGISIRYCFAVWICMSSIAISGESVRGLPFFVYSTCDSNPKLTHLTPGGRPGRYAELLESL